jgi:hypothetical protein
MTHKLPIVKETKGGLHTIRVALHFYLQIPVLAVDAKDVRNRFNPYAYNAFDLLEECKSKDWESSEEVGPEYEVYEGDDVWGGVAQ